MAEASVRLIGLTAPVHDAEDLGLEGPPELMKFAGDLYGGAPNTEVIDTIWVVEAKSPVHRMLTRRFGHLGADYNQKPEGPHTLCFKANFADLKEEFETAQFDPTLNVVFREVLGVMYDMLVVDFPEVFTRNPREVDE
jgi:hypothetical protein